MSIDEDEWGAGRVDSHEDYEDNADDKDDYNDTGCDLFKVSMAMMTMITPQPLRLPYCSYMMTMMVTLTKHTIMIITT